MSSTEQVKPATGRNARPLITSQDALDAADRGYLQPIDLMSTNVQAMTQVGVLEPISGFEFKTLAEYEKFMEEPVVIEILTTTDPNAPKAVFIGVNGDSRWLPRGMPLKLQRKFVERLAQAQEMRYETKRSKDPESDMGMDTLRSTAQSYQFSVLEDKNPIGRKWLLRVTRQGS